MLTYAITDVHGRFDLLERALNIIAALGGDHKLVFLGDYVDRGPDSRRVVERIMTLSTRPNVTVLRGNHEDIFVNYIERPEAMVNIFQEQGGEETLRSYRRGNVVDGALMLRHCQWMKHLPTWHFDGLRVFVHAGIAPGKPIDRQDAGVLMWTRSRAFLDATRERLGYHVVHGHTAVHETKKIDCVESNAARTNLDSGACWTGILTVGVFEDNQERPVDFLNVGGNDLRVPVRSQLYA